MNTITHALLPVIAAGLIERVNKGEKRNGIFSNREILLLGLFGAGPDLLNPHLSLVARYTSWSHGLPFWAGLTLVMLVVSLFMRKKFPPGMAIWFSAAYLLHQVCDFIAGGVAWMYPWERGVVGDYYVPPQYWAWIDAGCVLLVYSYLRILPHFNRKRFHGSQDTKM